MFPEMSHNEMIVTALHRVYYITYVYQNRQFNRHNQLDSNGNETEYFTHFRVFYTDYYLQVSYKYLGNVSYTTNFNFETHDHYCSVTDANYSKTQHHSDSSDSTRVGSSFLDIEMFHVDVSSNYTAYVVFPFVNLKELCIRIQYRITPYIRQLQDFSQSIHDYSRFFKFCSKFNVLSFSQLATCIIIN